MRFTTIIILALCAVTLFSATTAVADVAAVPVGIKFTYDSADAGSVHLAGSFNGWDSQKNPLIKGDNNIWTIVMALKPGKHEYKFVVDGSWFADPGNPDSEPDSFGGANSIVQIDDKGRMIAVVKKAVSEGPNTALNARINLKGRYLGLYSSQKNVNGDPRYRLQRPNHSVDLNFNTKVSDVVTSYTRMRIDNTNDAELNNVQVQMDEAALDLHPGPFQVTGYWDMETLQLSDPLSSGGDVDLAGTLVDDHLQSGKGTGGITFEAQPFGVDLQGFLADSHDFDPNGPDDIFDNMGRDFIGMRLSRPVSGATFGVNAYAVRDLYDFQDNNLIDGRPTALDDHIAETGDNSERWRYQRSDIRKGMDFSLPFATDKALFQAQWMYGTFDEDFFAGDKSGPDNINGVIDAVMNTRTQRIYHSSLDYELPADLDLKLEHTFIDESGHQAGEETLVYIFSPMTTANNQVQATTVAALGNTNSAYTEALLNWKPTHSQHSVWFQQTSIDSDALPGSETPLDLSLTWTSITTVHHIGQPSDKLGRYNLETSWMGRDADGIGWKGSTFEAILRSKRQVGDKTFLVADIRVIDYDLESVTDEATQSGTFWNHWLGLEYAPLPTLNVTVAYGVDPLDFGIDYSGRQIGRWRFRQEYMFDNPGSTEVDAESALEDVRAIGIRAQMRF
jgi:hypothetical protein